MVGEPRRHGRLVEEVEALYAWIDEQLAQQPTDAGQCQACGECCDFVGYDHLLFVTPPELIYLAEKLNVSRLRQMTSGRCPYQEAAKCTVHPHRFAGCRVFGCRGNAEFQSDLTEEALRRLKAICEEFDVPYRYADLARALANFTNDSDLSAGEPCPGDCAE
jgi:Fe-S-cluster containining protein